MRPWQLLLLFTSILSRAAPEQREAVIVPPGFNLEIINQANELERRASHHLWWWLLTAVIETGINFYATKLQLLNVSSSAPPCSLR